MSIFHHRILDDQRILGPNDARVVRQRTLDVVHRSSLTPQPFPFHPVAPPAPSDRHTSRLSASFPTFLYASEPPPPTARNKQRVRPTAAQLAELKALFLISPHPTRDVREALGERIGMRYQSVTNWFQNQRSTAKKRTAAPESPDATSPNVDVDTSGEDDDEDHNVPVERPQPIPPRRIDPVRDIIVSQKLGQLPLPLSGTAIAHSTTTPSLNITLPPPPSTYSRGSTSPLVSSFQVSRTSSPAVASQRPTPPPLDDLSPDYGEVPRGKRSRPTPHQLAVLRALHATTSSPSIEERTRVGREIGMELGKVTNWFRNLRQTARKRERRAEGNVQLGKRAHPGDSSRTRQSKRSRMVSYEDDDDLVSISASADTSSTVGTMDIDHEYEHRVSFSRHPIQQYEEIHQDYFLNRPRYEECHVSNHEQHNREKSSHREHEEARSDQGTESDTAHEAVTPEPHTPSPTPGVSDTLDSETVSPGPFKHASIDDAMLLLEFHSVRT